MPFDEEGARGVIQGGDPLLSLRWQRVEDAGAARLAEVLRAARGAHRVEEVDLTGCAVGDAGVGALCGALEADGKIKSLGLGSNAFGDGGMGLVADLLRRSSTCGLTALDLSGSRATDAGVEAVAAALAAESGGCGGCGGGCLALEALQLSRSTRLGEGLGPGAATALGGMLRRNGTLRSLSLWGAGLGDAGAAELAQGLSANDGLTALDLGWNGVGDEGCAALAEALGAGRNETLRTLVSGEAGGYW